MRFQFQGKVWRWQGEAPAAWHFITLPEEIAAQVRFFSGKAKGFGSVRVKAVIGSSVWKTSLFPDKKSNSFLLPVKSEVRKAEVLKPGQIISVQIDLGL